MTGSLKEAMRGADVFVALSAPDVLTGDDVAAMAPGAVVFALANPDPEVDPVEAARTAAVVATGRSDAANQMNNVLAFPGVFRGCSTRSPAPSTRPHAARRRSRRWPPWSPTTS